MKFFRKFFLKKVTVKYVYPLLLSIISILFLYPLLNNSFYLSHDGQVQIARIAAYFKALQDFDLFPRWAKDLNFGYGSPVFIFFYPLPEYLGSLVHFFGFSFEQTFKIIVGVSFAASPLSFYLWTSKFLSRKDSFFASLFYGLAPYHFLDLYVRGDVGELLSFVFIPLVLWSILKNKVLVGSLLFALLVLSHHGIALLFSPILFFYTFLDHHTKRELFKSWLIFILGLLVSSFFWVPSLIEGKYTLNIEALSSVYLNNFPTLKQIISSPWGFAPSISKQNGLSPQIGYTSFIFAFRAYFVYFSKNLETNILSSGV